MRRIIEPAQTRRSRQDGFTLIEALIAMVVLVFGLVAVTNLLLMAASSNTVASHSSAATMIASQRMETLKGLAFGDAGLASGKDQQTVTGIGQIETVWTVTTVDARTRFIRVRSESLSPIARARSRAEFTTLRVCSATDCP